MTFDLCHRPGSKVKYQMTNNFFFLLNLSLFWIDTKLFVYARASVRHQNQLPKYNSKKSYDVLNNQGQVKGHISENN